MAPPDAEGYVLTVVPDGQYTIEEPLLTLQLMDGTERTLTMTQKWPIHAYCAVCQAVPGSEAPDHRPAYSDTMFPLAKGGIGSHS